MIPASFRYAAPRSISDAVDLLRTYEDAKILAGGHSLLPLMKLRLANPPAERDLVTTPIDIEVTNGVPIDTDGEGLADYFEDTNGNGTYESASDLSNWNAADTDGDGVNDYLECIQGRNPKVANANADTNDDTKLRVFTPLK